MTLCVLGLDPGFASVGCCVMELTPDGEKVLETLVFKTEKSDKKRKVRASDDNFRRGQELSAMLVGLLHRYPDVKACCAEFMSHPRNASVSGQLGSFWGIIELLTYIWKLPMLQASPQEIKKVLTGKKNASKLEVQVALQARYPGQFDPYDAIITRKADVEHGYDAAGAVVACLDSDVIQMMRGLL